MAVEAGRPSTRRGGSRPAVRLAAGGPFRQPPRVYLTCYGPVASVRRPRPAAGGDRPQQRASFARELPSRYPRAGANSRDDEG